jgi:hypothetical protein
VAEPIFDPLRVLAELNALGVRYVLAGDLAAGAPQVSPSADRVELRVADDDDNIERLRLFLQALGAELLDDSDDSHHAAFGTTAGRVDCLELEVDAGFAELRDRAIEVNFGDGVVARAVPPDEVVVVPRDARDLIGALRAASLSQNAPATGGARGWDEDEFGPESAVEGERMTRFRRVWKVFEDIDTFMNDLNERPLRRPREPRGSSGDAPSSR